MNSDKKQQNVSTSNLVSRIIYFSVYHRSVILLMTAVAAIFGWLSFQNLPIDAVPDITNVQVQVNTTVEGLAPEEIERTITYPIETAMGGIAGVTQVRSITKFGLSQVTVSFEDETDIYRARQLVSERLQTLATQFPRNIRPKLGPITTGLGEVVFYSIEAEKIESGDARFKQLMELRTIQEFYVKPRLLTVKGVAEINTIGGFEKQFHVQPKAAQMARYGLHFGDLLDALTRTNQNVGGGYIQQTGEQFLVQATGLLRSIEDIQNVPVKSLETLKSIMVGDVANVTLATELRTGAALIHGQEAVLGTVMMLTGENSRTVSTRVSEQIKDIQKGLPAGIKIESLYNRSDLVNATLNTVIHNLMTGAALVILILLALIGNARAAVITAFVIPLSLLITFIVMKRYGISGNLMSLGALDFGIIVDGAVIVLDNCVRFVHDRAKELRRKLTGEEVRKAVYDATIQIRTAAGFGELIIVVVFLPIFALVGIEGKMFKPMAATFAIAVVAALILSFTTVPALASIFLRGDAKEEEPWLTSIIKRGYAPLLSASLRRKGRTLAVALFSTVLGVFLFARLGGEFLPQLDEGSLVIQFIRPPTISIDESVTLEAKSQQLIEKFSEVGAVFGRIGTAEVATDPMGINLSDTFIMLKERNVWPKYNGHRRTKSELANAIVEELNSAIPGQRTLLSQPIQMRFNELLEGTRADVSVKVYGDEMETLADITKQVSSVIGKVKGAGDVELELRGTSPVLKVTPKEGILKRLGVSNREVLETVGVALGGEEVGLLYEGVKRFPIVVRLSEEVRSDLDAIRSLPVGISANATIPLHDAADVQFSESYASISREQSKRRAAVLVNPRGRDTESFVLEAQKSVEATVKLPTGYYIEWGGNFKNLQEARSRLLVLTPIAMILVLMMIYAAFGNTFQTGLIFSCVPLALVGGGFGLILNRLPFSISAGVGFIALSGIAVLNGVVLMNYFNDLRKQGLRGEELVKTGSLIRLRPVLMTALVDIFGFLPMMLSTGVGAEVQKPLASVVIGGIISSTLLTLVVLPTLYKIFETRMASDGE